MNKETNIRELLVRYMDGDCTQEELRQLKEYFGSTKDLPADLAPYGQMFAIIDEKQATPSAEALDRFAEGQMAVRRRNPLWPLLAAAACITAFAVILLAPPQKEENMAIAYVDGKMITDETLAMQMGKEVLGEIFSNGNEEQQLNELFNAP